MQARLLLCLLVALSGFLGRSTGSDSSNLTDPLLYMKLRFDLGYLQFTRNYQKYETFREKEIRTKYTYLDYYNQTKTKDVLYYQSEEHESSAFQTNETIVEVIDRIYLSKIIHYNIFTYDNPVDRKRSADPKLVSPERCNREIDLLLRKLDQLEGKRVTSFSDVSALKFFDNYGAKEPAFYIGNRIWLGDWRECHKRYLFSEEGSSGASEARQKGTLYSLKGRHCVGSIRNSDWDPIIADKVNRTLHGKRPYFKYPEQQYDYARFFKLYVGFCLPESCDSSIVETRQDDLRRLVTFKLEEPFKSFNLSDLYCWPDEGSPMRKLDLSSWLFILFAVSWTSLTLGATLLDVLLTKMERLQGPKKHSGLLALIANRYQLVDNSNQSEQDPTKRPTKKFMAIRSALSVVRNYQRFVDTSSAVGVCKKIKESIVAEESAKREGRMLRQEEGLKLDRSDAQFLNSFKFLAMLHVAVAHCRLILWDTSKHQLDFGQYDGTYIQMYVMAAAIAIDVFLFITGMITSYSLFITNSIYKMTAVQWLYSIFRRYWRIAPTLVIIFWFMRSLFPYTNSGPLWDYASYNRSIRSICKRESWLNPLTLTTNWYPLHEECIMPAWYSGLDFQLHLFMPFLMIPMAKSAALGWFLSLSSVIISFLFRYHFFISSPRARLLDVWQPMADMVMMHSWDIHPTYLFPHMRAGSYILGLLAGHYVYMVLSGKWTSFMFVHPGNCPAPSIELTRRDQPDSGTGAAKELEQPLEEGLVSKKSSLAAQMDRASSSRKLVWWSGLTTTLMLYNTPLFLRYQVGTKLDSWAEVLAPLQYTLGFTLTALGFILMSVPMMLGEYPRVRLFLSHPIFSFISRTLNMFYLIQIEILYYFIQGSDYHMDKIFSDQTIICVNIFVLNFILSAVLVVVLEMPLLNLEKMFAAVIFAARPAKRSNRREELDHSAPSK